MNENDIDSDLSAKEQREQFEIGFREAIKSSIPCQNILSIKMLNEMLNTFGNLCSQEGYDAGYEDGIKYARNFGTEVNRLNSNDDEVF